MTWSIAFGYDLHSFANSEIWKRSTIFGTLENGALDALKLTSSRMYHYLSFQIYDKSVVQALLLDRCDEITGLGDNESCPNGDNSQVRIKYCERRKYADVQRNNGSWNYTWEPPEPDHDGGFLVCATCRNHNFNNNGGWKRLNRYVDGIQNHRAPLRGLLPDPWPWFGTLAEVCDPCAQGQEVRHPLGINLCTCKHQQRRHWLCLMCAGDSLHEVYWEQHALRRRLKRVHRVNGEVRYDRKEPRRTRFCPACGIRKARRVLREGFQNTKTCLLCRKFVVQGTTAFGPVGPPATVATTIKQPTRRRKALLGSAGPSISAPIPTRRSARLTGGAAHGIDHVMLSESGLGYVTQTGSGFGKP